MTESIPSGALKVAELLPCPMDRWVDYAKRGGLLDENGVAPDRVKAQTAFYAFSAAWNESHRAVVAALASPDPQATGALSDEVRQAGALMANTAFNLAQNPGRVLSDADCKLFKSMQVKWDAALSSAKREATGALTTDAARAILVAARDDGCYLGFDPSDPDKPVWETWHDGTTRVLLDDSYTAEQLRAMLHFAPGAEA